MADPILITARHWEREIWLNQPMKKSSLRLPLPYNIGVLIYKAGNLLSKQFLLQKITIMDQQNWAAKLLWYKPGLENRGADARHTLMKMRSFKQGKEVVEEVYRDKVLHGIIDHF